MSDNTPRLNLPELAAAQAQKHVTHNDALIQFDAFVDLYLLDKFLDTPPSSPADGDAYITGASPTGAWSGYAYKIAYCVDGAWRFYTPFNGLRAYDPAASEYITYLSGSWVDWLAVGPTGTVLNATGLGTSNSNPFPFQIDGSEIARFDTSGNLLVGRTTPYTSDNHTITKSAGGPSVWIQNSGTGGCLYLSTFNSTGSSAAALSLYAGSDSSAPGTNTFKVEANGNVLNTNNSYGAISDAKLKCDIAKAGSQWDDIKAIAGIVSKFRLKNDPAGPFYIGIVAQDLVPISPGLVEHDQAVTTGTETLSVKYSVLYMKAVKALGEAMARIEALEERLAAIAPQSIP